MTVLVPVITKKGLEASFNADNTGVAAKIVAIALGDDGRQPSSDEEGLVNEILRIPVADGQRVNPTQIHITGLVDHGPAMWIREIGFILEDGTMFAVWSNETPLAYKPEGGAIPLLLALDLVLAAIPAETITVEGTGANLSLAAWGEQFLASSAAIIENMARHVDLEMKVAAMGR